MTEAEWHSCKYAGDMIDYLKQSGRADARKCRLFICALSRVLWDALGHKTHHRLVELAEDYADGLIPFAELAAGWAMLPALQSDRRPPAR
jgi:hypothetical protein